MSTAAGWLKQLTKRHFTIDELTSGDEFTIDRQKVRTYKAIYQETRIIFYFIL